MGFGADTQVLTESGWQSILNVDSHRIWDGESFKQHGGLLCYEDDSLIQFAGVVCSANQLFFAGYSTSQGERWLTPDYFAVAEQARYKAIRAAKRLINPTYYCKLARQEQVKAIAPKLFDIASLPMVLVLTYLGPLIARCDQA